MEKSLSIQFLGNELSVWLTVLLYIVGAYIASKISYFIISKIVKRLARKTKTTLDDILVEKLETPITLALVLVITRYGISQLTMLELYEKLINNTFEFLYYINCTWILSRVISAVISELIMPMTENTERVDNNFIRILQKFNNIIIWGIGLIIALDNVGFDVAAVIASLGIGGLALAMAAKDTVSNVFGGFTIFADKSFKVNDRIRVAGFDGTVLSIGVRSFRLMTLQGTIVTIPNSKITEGVVENVSLEPSRKVTLNLGLTYSTKPEQIEQALEILKQIALSNKKVEDNYLISFNDFGDFSLGILFVYYIIKGEDILLAQSEINLEILRQFNEAGFHFAFPTQTLHLEK